MKITGICYFYLFFHAFQMHRNAFAAEAPDDTGGGGGYSTGGVA